MTLADAVREANREDRPHTMYYRPSRRHAWRVAGYTLTRRPAIEWAHAYAAQSGMLTLALPSDVTPTDRVAKLL